MKNTDYNVEILVDGKPQKIHYYNGRYYVEGRENYEYSIKVKNNSYNKILAVVSVDSLSVMDGEIASNDSGGYIIEAFSSYNIQGYRKDLESVGAFKFSKKHNSYAKSKGNNAEKNVGIIGIRIFEEKQKPAPIIIKEKEYIPYPVYPSYPRRNPYWPYEYDNAPYWGTPITCSNANYDSVSQDSLGEVRCYNSSVSSIKNSIADEGEFSLGSTWGSKITNQVTETTFDRGNLVFSQDIYYSTRADLIKMGVPIIKEPKISYPSSFPKSFCSPPSGWE